MVAISTGDAHTCALTDDGGVKCWGNNDIGQLGIGTTIESSNRPLDVSGLDKDVIAISAGYKHTCALIKTGKVSCWGWNMTGQLGIDSADIISNIPVDVVGLDDDVIAIGSGGLHTCALTDRGGVKCWGSNVYSQLGNNTKGSSSSPRTVSKLDRGVSALSVGSLHTCVIMNRGAIKCWGMNNFGELGNADADNMNATPVDVEGLTSEVTALSLGNFYTCVVTKRGGIQCWGKGTAEEKGSNVRIDSSTPVDITGLRSGASQISAGGSHTCVLTNAGVKCWGNNTYGQLGDGKAWYTTPVDL